MKYSWLLIVFYCLCSFSQTKTEKEERIHANIFPENARLYFNSINNKVNRLKYYRETDGETLSFEVKFKYKKEHYSIEFDTLGRLEDIEIVTKKRYIPKSIYHAISDYFNTSYKKFTIIKFQKQYRNTKNTSDVLFIREVLNNPMNKHTHFEIIAEVKTKNKFELREVIFDKNGIYETSRQVSTTSYEHALY